jgi:RNA recognition motif-containing protein
MIKLDLANASDEELEAIVTAHCSECGPVSQVIIMRDTNHPFALALVVMADRSDASAVLRNLGDTMLKHAVVIRLEQQ